MRLSVIELVRVGELAFKNEKFNTCGGVCLDSFEFDYYWSVGFDCIEDFASEDPKICIGSLYDDWEELLNVLTCNRGFSITDFERFGEILYFIGHIVDSRPNFKVSDRCSEKSLIGFSDLKKLLDVFVESMRRSDILEVDFEKIGLERYWSIRRCDKYAFQDDGFIPKPNYSCLIDVWTNKECNDNGHCLADSLIKLGTMIRMIGEFISHSGMLWLGL
ncbi:hypothetical protein ACFLY6_02715 [Candidatus Dependentiae bacterium]